MQEMDAQTEFKWPVSAEKTIDAPAHEVWAAIAAPGNLELCHPFCASNPVQDWPGANARDEIHYLSGWQYERRFNRWMEGVGYDLDIGRNGADVASVSWRISKTDEQSCILRITVCPHALQNLPAMVRWIPHMLWLRPMLRKYLNSVVNGFDWYVIRGEPVPRNQFGTHPWFSARGEG